MRVAAALAVAFHALCVPSALGALRHHEHGDRLRRRRRPRVCGRAEIGKPTAVNVLAESTAGGAHDLAPDLGTIHYKLTPLVLTISSFTAMRSARAERLELGVTRSDSGGPLLGEPPLCHGRVAGKVVFATVLDDARVGQRACCAWKFPKALVGKKARLTITIPYAGRKVSRSVSLTIR
jgi:hypothetical protein